MIKILVGRRLTITGLDLKLQQPIKDFLTLDNPAFYILERMGKYVGATPKEFKYYKNKGTKLIIPRGLFHQLTKYLSKKGKAWGITRKVVSIKTDLLEKNFELREYQDKFISKIDPARHEGVLSMTTGAGKTLVSLEVARKLGLTATILVPSNFILQQFKKECKEKFNFEPGIIGGGKRDIKDVTVATFQSLQKNKKLLQDLVAKTSILIVDECQGVPADGRAKIIQKFNPDYLFGLSGTPDRTDGRAKAIFFFMGPIIAKYEGTFLKPFVDVIYTHIKIPKFIKIRRKIKGRKIIVKKRLNYHETIDRMIDNESRNRLVAGLAVGEMMTGRKVLVLTKRVAHYKNMQKMVNFHGVHFIDSKDPDRNTLMATLKDFGDFNGIFGTVSLLGVGTDIPALDTLIIACDIKSRILTTQSVGRILRLFEGKQTPKIIDLCDNKHKTLYRQYKAREKLYISKGWHVRTPWDEYNKK